MSTSQHGRTRQGQPALEFMVMLGLTLLIYAAFYGMFTGRQGQALQEEQQLAATDLADRVGFQLDLALAEGNGFARTFTLPDSLNGANYTVDIAGATVFLSYGDRSVVADTAADAVVGTVMPGTNRVRNDDGTLHITHP